MSKDNIVCGNLECAWYNEKEDSRCNMYIQVKICNFVKLICNNRSCNNPGGTHGKEESSKQEGGQEGHKEIPGSKIITCRNPGGEDKFYRYWEGFKEDGRVKEVLKGISGGRKFNYTPSKVVGEQALPSRPTCCLV